MLNEFGPGELPGGDIKGASKDMTSYIEIEEDVKLISGSCVLKRGLFGWMQIGIYYMLRSSLLTLLHHSSIATSLKLSNLGIHFHQCFASKAGNRLLWQVLINSVRHRQ